MACMIQAQRDRPRSSTEHWGCGARNENGSYRMWNQPSKEKAREDALTNCESRFGPCKLISCSPNVPTRERGYALWPSAHRQSLPYTAARVLR
jgi:hypothetical protein